VLRNELRASLNGARVTDDQRLVVREVEQLLVRVD
jgi:hypothetical protein